MKHWRWLLPLLLLLALFLVDFFPSLTAKDVVKRAELAEDRQTIRVVGRGGEVVLEHTIGEWLDWASENLDEALGAPIRIGPQEMSPSTFDSFGAAGISPDGVRLALSAQAYALLTTASVVGILDLDDMSFEAVSEPAFGGVQQFHWSPGGEYVAYPLGTARALGDRLRVDDVSVLRPVLELDGEVLIEAARRQGLEVNTDARNWLPQIRDLSWSAGDRLRFTTDGFDGAELHWSVSPELEELKLE